MKLNELYNLNSLEEIQKTGITSVVAAIGIFDGIHLGHRKIISELFKLAKKHDSTPIIITFNPHPKQLFNPSVKFQFLRSPEEKAEIFANLGIKAMITIPFTRQLSQISAEQFLQIITHIQGVPLKAICVGKHWRFGSKGLGSWETLTEYSDAFGYEFKPVDEVKLEETVISSSLIRKMLQEGKFQIANKMLDSKYCLTANIISQEVYPKSTNFIADLTYGVMPFSKEYPANIYCKNIVTKGIFIPINSDKLIIKCDSTVIFTNSKIKIDLA